MAQPYYTPPDPWGDNDNTNYAVWPNQGQVVNELGDSVPGIAFYAEGGIQTYFQQDGLFSMVHASRDTVAGVDTLQRVDVSCTGTRANYPDPEVSNARNWHANFYLPQCGPAGATDVQPSGRLIYPQAYPDIDLHFYSGQQGQKMAFVVLPGGNPGDIQLHFQGQDSLTLDSSGNLWLMLAGSGMVLPGLVAYQADSLGNVITLNWTASFVVDNATATVTISSGTFDHALPLVFVSGPSLALPCCFYDAPGLCWSTFYGAEDFDFPKDVKTDANGNIYVTGRTESLWTNFPHAFGQTTNLVGTSMATLTKFNADHELKWTIFQGGISLGNSKSSGAAVAYDGNIDAVYMAGSTDASDFYTWALNGAYNDLNSNNTLYKGFVGRYAGLDGAIQWSTYIGKGKVWVDGLDIVPWSGRIAIAGVVQGNQLPPGSFLPPFNGYAFNANHGQQDAFVAYFQPDCSVDWCAYYGGDQNEDFATVRCVGKDIVLAGNTRSANLLPPAGPVGSFQQNYQGNRDVFIVEFNDVGLVEWSTWFGGAGNEALAPQGMAGEGDLFLTGTCQTLPAGILVNGPGWYDASPGAPNINGFIARFQEDSRVPLWITYLGDGPVAFTWQNIPYSQHSPSCITTVENNGTQVIVGGYTDDNAFPVTPANGMYNQPGFVADQNYVKDGFIIRFDAQQQLEWATYFGGQGGSMDVPENVTGLSELGGNLYAVGYTSQSTGVVQTPIPLSGHTNSAMFFNPNYNFDGSSGNYSDGFITEFCNDYSTFKSVEEEITPSTAEWELHTTWSSSGSFTLLGLPDGLHRLQVYDAQGRLVLECTVASQGGRSQAVPLHDPSAAVYLLVVDHARTGRLVPIR